MHRVMQLADRKDPTEKPSRPSFTSLIPLKEILSEILGVGVQSKRVSSTYHTLIERLGPEFSILLDHPLDEIKAATNELLAEAIRRMRQREVIVQQGYDGEYGRITVFTPEERNGALAQDSLFDEAVSRPRKPEPVQTCRESAPLNRPGMPVPAGIGEHDGKQQDPSGKEDLLAQLDRAQTEAVHHGQGPALVLAGPGSGKTRVLTSRIITLLQTGLARPQNCLAITFTNKASDEMRERLDHLLKPEETARLSVMTFHAFGHTLLTEYNTREERPHLTLIDSEEKDWILTRILESPKARRKQVAEAITLSKLERSEPHTTSQRCKLEDIQTYEAYLRANQLMDLDDLIAQPVILFREDPEFLKEIRERIRWILVDEFQDVNPAQYRLLRTLMPDPEANLFIIGDPDQAIYGFRGADTRSVEHFRNDYPAAKLYHLATSYRCTDRILQISRSVLLGENEHQIHTLKGLQEGVKCRISAYRSDRGEAEFVARSIENFMGGLRFFSIDSDVSRGEVQDDISGFSDFAVLCRIHRQFNVVEKAFIDHSIPYQTVGEMPFFKQEPIRSIIDLLRYAQAPGNAHLDRRVRASSTINIPETWTEQAGMIRRDSVKNAVEHIVDKWLTEDRSNHAERLDRLIRLADEFENDFDAFLNRTLLGKTVAAFRPATQNVTLMTLHAAKGLEFTVVFIIGCEDGLIPYRLHDTTSSSEEEEKRLLYVGMTRAKRHLFLSHAERRMLFGRFQQMKRSPFLDKIEDAWIEHIRPASSTKSKKTDRQMGLF